ncbi:hypothetical protein Sste5344_006363 [Sporothrix stenoceras]
MLAGNTTVASVVETFPLPFGVRARRLGLTLCTMCLSTMGVLLGYMYLLLSNGSRLSMSMRVSMILREEMPMAKMVMNVGMGMSLQPGLLLSLGLDMCLLTCLGLGLGLSLCNGGSSLEDML